MKSLSAAIPIKENERFRRKLFKACITVNQT